MWKKVSGRIGPPLGFAQDYDAEYQGFWHNLVEFYLEVWTQEESVYQRSFLTKDELERCPGLYKAALDEMVSAIDARIKETLQ